MVPDVVATPDPPSLFNPEAFSSRSQLLHSLFSDNKKNDFFGMSDISAGECTCSAAFLLNKGVFDEIPVNKR